MTFPYNNGIPATNNDPSVDQPDMLINTQSINGILATDHISFNAQNGGQHKAIHFNQDASYVPVVFPVNPPQLFTDVVAGLPQLKFYSGTQNQSANQYSLASNWSTFVFGGMVLKGGMITVSFTTQVFTYSTLSPALQPFPNATLSVILTPISNTPGGVLFNVPAVTSTTFTVRTSVTGVQYYFLAIGY